MKRCLTFFLTLVHSIQEARSQPLISSVIELLKAQEDWFWYPNSEPAVVDSLTLVKTLVPASLKYPNWLEVAVVKTTTRDTVAVIRNWSSPLDEGLCAVLYGDSVSFIHGDLEHFETVVTFEDSPKHPTYYTDLRLKDLVFWKNRQVIHDAKHTFLENGNGMLPIPGDSVSYTLVNYISGHPRGFRAAIELGPQNTQRITEIMVYDADPKHPFMSMGVTWCAGAASIADIYMRRCYYEFACDGKIVDTVNNDARHGQCPHASGTSRSFPLRMLVTDIDDLLQQLSPEEHMHAQQFMYQLEPMFILASGEWPFER